MHNTSVGLYQKPGVGRLRIVPLRHKTFIIQLYNGKCKACRMQSKVVWVRSWTQAQYMRQQCRGRQCLHGKACTIKEVMFSRLQSIINEVKYSRGSKIRS